MITEILKLARANKEGFTIFLIDLSPVTEGIAVAYAETQNSHDSESLERCIEHAKQHEGVIGGWFDRKSKKYYFDSIKIFKTDQLAEAMVFGRKNRQIAIFDLTNLREIRL
jgi:fructokinase